MSDDQNGLPPGWAAAVLSELAAVRLGRQRSPSRATGPNMRQYVRAANVRWDGISVADVKTMDFSPTEFEAFRLRKGDILVVEGSGSATEVGKPAVWDDEVPDCCFQNTLIRVRADETLVPFLHRHFQHDARSGAFARSSRGVGIHHIGAKALTEWAIAVPPLNEQKRIVAKIEALQAHSEAAKEALDAIGPLLEKFRQSVLAAAFRGDLTKAWRAKHPDVEPATELLKRIRAERRRRWEEAKPGKKYKEPEPVDASGLPELPEGWARARLANIAEVRLGRQRSPDRATGPNMRPYMRAANVTWDGISLHDVKEMDFNPREFETFRLRRGDLLIVEGSGSASEVGKPAIWNDEVADCCLQNTLIRVRAPLSLVPFLFRHFQNDARGGAFSGSSRGVGIHHIGSKALENWVVVVPPESEQTEIERIVAECLDFAATVARRYSGAVRSHDALNKSILAKAFRGELVPQDPNDEPASVLLERIRAEREAKGAKTTKRGRGRAARR